MNQVAEQVTQYGITDWVDSYQSEFNEAVSDNNIVWNKERGFALQVLNKPDNKNKNELCFAGKTALNNPLSLQAAIVNVAAIGVTLNPASKLAYLVPRDGAICLDISYMGLLHIAQQSGSIMWGQCKLVYANDTYESNGLDKAPTHKYQAFGDRGAIVGGYCTAKTVDGDYLTEEMSIADIDKVKATSKAGNGPWKTFFEEMARKTIVKRASKYWPKVERLDNAINYLNTEGGEGLQDVTEEPKSEFIIGVDNHILKLAEAQERTEKQLFEWLSKAFKREIQCFDDMNEDEKQFIARKLECKA